MMPHVIAAKESLGFEKLEIIPFNMSASLLDAQNLVTYQLLDISSLKLPTVARSLSACHCLSAIVVPDVPHIFGRR
jgi:hypothetical protein